MASKCRSRVPATTTNELNMRLGRVFLNNRYYDPTTGVFLSVDPLVAKTGDPYLYAGGNPTTRSDPTGLAACEDGNNCGSFGYGASPCAHDSGNYNCVKTSSGGYDVRWSPKGKQGLVAGVGGKSNINASAASFGVAGRTRIGDLSGSQYSLAVAAFFGMMSRTVKNFDISTFTGDSDGFVVQDLPIFDVLVAAGPGTVGDVASALTLERALPSSAVAPAAATPRKYDRDCGCGQMMPADTTMINDALGFLSSPNTPDEVVPWMLTSAATSFVPMSASIAALGVGLMIDGFLLGSAVPIDPNVAAYPQNYWMELSGLPATPPG